MYAATIGEVDAVRLLQPETVEAMCVLQTEASKPYGQVPQLEVLAAFEMPLALGFMRPSRFMPLLGPRSFGHPGAGGSLGFADPDAKIGLGYVMNRMSSDINDQRVTSLIEATARCVS